MKSSFQQNLHNMKSQLQLQLKNTNHGRRPQFWLLLVSFGILSTFIFLYFPRSFDRATPKQSFSDQQNFVTEHENDEICDLFTGRWVPDPRGSIYTNESCSTIPDSLNCGKHGRIDSEYVNWRWKPDGCELRRFQPETFLNIVRGKKLAFIGDSLARNQMESLLCLLSQVENPRDIYKDSADRIRHWYFASHDFTLIVLWTRFLVIGKEREMNGSLSSVFDIYLDELDTNWTETLHQLDLAIISDGNWFFRKSYFYEKKKLVSCLYCTDENITEVGLGFALKKAFQTAVNFINGCKDCKSLVTVVRTFSPSHFENGAWNTGGNCNRTRPVSEKKVNLEGIEWEIRKSQLEVLQTVEGEGKKIGRKFRALDVTEAMLMRPDGHPGAYYNSKWTKELNDCLHWCLPGPIDAWNDLLLEILRKELASS